jgi:hypothetical protein
LTQISLLVMINNMSEAQHSNTNDYLPQDVVLPEYFIDILKQRSIESGVPVGILYAYIVYFYLNLTPDDIIYYDSLDNQSKD